MSSGISRNMQSIANYGPRQARPGLLCASIPEEYGGAGGNFAHEAVLIDALGKRGVDGWGIVLHNQSLRTTSSTTDPKSRRNAGCRGWRRANRSAHRDEEPGTGSDLQGVKTTARRDGNHYRHQRLEDLHHEWRHGQFHHRGGQDRSRPGARKGISLVMRGDGRGRRISPRARCSRRSASKRTTRPSCSSTTCACRRRI